MIFKPGDKAEKKSIEKSHWDKLAFRKTLGRIFRYSGVRILSILLTVGLGLYLTLLVLNMGGYVDEIMRGQISQRILGMGMAGYFDDIPEDEQQAYAAQLEEQMAESMGLNEPLAVRTARWWFKAVTLQLGDAKDAIFGALPYTLLLIGLANVILFFASLWIAMVLSTQRGNFWDRLLASLTPISSAPSWVHGVILLAIFALELQIFPFKGMFEGTPPENTLEFVSQLAMHMVLPVTAIVLSVFFQGVYTWRTFFMVHSGEDYVDLALAKGLPKRIIRRRYLLRPTLPSVITSFALMLLSFWEGAIALEWLFEWPGMGALFLRSIYSFNRPVVVGIVVMLAYLLGFSVILLDVIYALIDPRVRLGGNRASPRQRAVRQKSAFRFIKKIFTRQKGLPPDRSAKRNRPAKEQPQPAENRELSPPQDIETPAASKTAGSPQQLEELQASHGALDVEQAQQSETRERAQPLRVADKRTSFLRDLMGKVGRNLFKYPMASVGLAIIVFLFIVAVGTVIAIPYQDAVDYWHSEGFILTPRLARPTWINFFRAEKLPRSFFFDSTEETKRVVYSEERVPLGEDLTDIRMAFTFDFQADDFPQDLVLRFSSAYERKPPFASLILFTPDGRELDLASFKATDRLTFSLARENPVRPTTASDLTPVQKAFGIPETGFLTPLKGEYTLQVLSVVFEEDSDVNVEGTLHGKVFGLFGTDNQRRDLTIAMLWGTPVALTFGIVGAVVTTTTTILIAAFSAWYGGIVDEILQRITELNIILPTLAIVIMVNLLYSKSILVILSVVIIMNIFGNSLKEYRAMFLQFKESPYIEAAVAYGATNRRIIFTYMLPRIIQVMVPQLVISVPSFVFLEATLAYLGVVTPYLPTWGKVIRSSLGQGAFWGIYFWVLEPIVLVLITGLAFAFVGFALDKILNPRLRSQ